MLWVIGFILSFLSGSLMFSFWLPKYVYHVDIIKLSKDHNPGTANAMKHTSVAFGLLCLLSELLKGALPIWMCCKYLDQQSLWFALILAAPVLGHAFSPFLNGHGGKAIAVSFGVMIGFLGHSPMLIYLAFFYILFSVVLVLHPMQLRTVFSFLSCVICCWFFDTKTALLGAFLIFLIVSYKHLREKPQGISVSLFGLIQSKQKTSD